jgi:hypothetical protein
MKTPEECGRNPDPLTGAAGSHPLGTGLGGSAGALGGAALGAVFGPIGMLVGGIAGTLAGAAAGHATAERLDPTCEAEYWREQHDSGLLGEISGEEDEFDRDWLPAYRHGGESRQRLGPREWNDTLDAELAAGWPSARGRSTLDWGRARQAVRGGWERADRTFSAYAAVDGHFESHFESAEYGESGRGFDEYRSAYRYGVYARSSNPDRQWDDTIERELAPGWERARGDSSLEWHDARHAARAAWDRLQSGTGPDLR